MKQTIEVEVGPEDDAGTCLVVLGDRRHERWDVNTVRAFGLTVPEAEPERVGYPLQHVTESPFNGRISIHDHEEVLKPAHSLRVGDRLEWAPGDWREITEVERTPDNYVAIRVGTGTWYLKPFSLLAVRPA